MGLKKKNQFQRSGARDLLLGSSKVEDTVDDAMENSLHHVERRKDEV